MENIYLLEHQISIIDSVFKYNLENHESFYSKNLLKIDSASIIKLSYLLNTINSHTQSIEILDFEELSYSIENEILSSNEVVCYHLIDMFDIYIKHTKEVFHKHIRNVNSSKENENVETTIEKLNKNTQHSLECYETLSTLISFIGQESELATKFLNHRI